MPSSLFTPPYALGPGVIIFFWVGGEVRREEGQRLSFYIFWLSSFLFSKLQNRLLEPAWTRSNCHQVCSHPPQQPHHQHSCRHRPHTAPHPHTSGGGVMKPRPPPQRPLPPLFTLPPTGAGVVIRPEVGKGGVLGRQPVKINFLEVV